MSKRNFITISLITIFFIFIAFSAWAANVVFSAPRYEVKRQPTQMIPENKVTDFPIIAPTPIPTKKNQSPPQSEEWGKATQNSDGTYSMKVNMDDRMSTAVELYNALNNYRSVKGKSSLSWDDKLASYAQQRAVFICTNGGDGHAGFYDFINNQNGYDKLGYSHLGENLARMKMTGVHLVEWIYSQSPGHEKNQLGDWSHVGVGVSEYCSVVIFGGSKL